MNESEQTYEVEFMVNGKKQTVNFPKRLRIRPEQSKTCNAKGCMCGIHDSDLVCLRIELDDKEERVLGFDMKPCERNPNQAFRVIEGELPSVTIKKKKDDEN